MLAIIALPFFQQALIVGMTIALLLSLLGVFVVLRRLSFFADAIGHSALTGIAIGILLAWHPFAAAIAFTLLVALGMSALKQYSRLPLDTILGVLFPAAVAAGVIVVQLTPGYRSDLVGFLFGDILTVGPADILSSVALLIAGGVILILAGKKFVSITLNEALAQTEGIPVARYETLFLLLLAAAIALAIKFVGVILVTALVVIPAATAQNVSRSLRDLFIVSGLVSVVAVVTGMLASAAVSIPSGPAIVLAAAGLFLISLMVRPFRARRTVG